MHEHDSRLRLTRKAGSNRSSAASGQLLLLVTLLLGITGALGLAGCTSEPASNPQAPPEADLRRQFPEHATRVLAGTEGFVAVGDGFAAMPRGTAVEMIEQRGGLSAALPRRADQPIQFHLLSGLELRVRESGVSGDGQIVHGAIVYRRQAGASFWTVTEDGYEEWLMLGAGIATDKSPVASWEVEGGALRGVDGAVEIAGADGLVQLRVTAPLAFAAGDRPVPTRLSVHGSRIDLWADAGGEPVLVDPVWTTVPSTGVARQNHTATLLTNGKVLVVGGLGGTYLSSAQLYTPTTNSWAAAGSMATPRGYHVAARLQNGKVLVVGGFSGTAALTSAELYDPATDTWSPAGNMASARYDHAGVLLQSGRVLVASGQNASGVVGTAEQYDPTTNAWSPAGTLTTSRVRHAATLLSTGKVLVTGGNRLGVYVAAAELYNPATNNWGAAGSMGVARQDHAATLLSNGKVMVAGGYNGSAVSSVQLYDPVANTWAAGGSLASARRSPTLTTLASGKVLIAGGLGTLALATSELYDVAANTWTSGGSMFAGRYRHTATALADGRVLIACGFGSVALSSAEMFDPVANTWTAAGTLATGRQQHTATLLPGGKVIVAGGATSTTAATSSAQLFNPSTNLWSAAPSMSTDLKQHTATLLGNGKLLVVGGTGSTGYPTTVRQYDPVANGWTTDSVINAGRALHTATRFSDDRILIVGGSNATSTVASAELYDPASHTWATKTPMQAARNSHTATLLANGKVLVAGGTAAAPMQSAELYDPATNTWSPAGTMTSPRYRHSATLLASGKVLVAGGFSASAALNTADLYDPVANTWSATGAMASPRWGFAMAMASDGSVLVAGGVNASTYTANAEVYNPATGTWLAAAPMTVPRSNHTGTLLADGSVLVACGTNATGYLTGAEIYHPVVIDDGNPCTTDTWNPALGQVSHSAVANGTTCNDGSACTQTDTCQSGVCSGSNPVVCSASDQCHVAGTCDTATGACSNPPKANGTSCNDGNACTQSDSCQAGTCTGSNPVTCPSAPVCHDQATCNPATGLCPPPAPKPDGTSCNDGNVCTVQDSCAAGQCQPGTPAQVDDANACTIDACSPSQGITHTPVAAGSSCSDGDPCDGVESCNAQGQCIGGALWANGTPCGGDGNGCTLDACQQGVCTSTPQPGASCTDDNPCTSGDTCNASGQCQGSISSGSCSDGDACNGEEVCSAGACSPGTPINSDDGNPNTLDVCDPATGTVGHSDCSNLPDLTVSTTTAVRAKCLYAGPSPVQTGVAGQPFATTFDPFSPTAPFHALRVSIVRGRVLDQAGQPLGGVHASVRGRPEFGSTATRADGYFDLAVEGGGQVTVDLERYGYLPVLRTVTVPWQRQVGVPDASLVPVDPASNFVDLGEPTVIQVARGTPVSDPRGERQATVFYLPGTEATVVTPDGNGGYTQTPLNGEVDFRLTEYSVGPSGETAMPMDLPAASAFTYAVELGIDGIPPDSTVEFTGPGVIGYLENFLGFPVGETVPSGFLDRTAARWVADDTGRVVKITSITTVNGIPEAVVDTVGATQNPTVVLDTAERRRLATLYEPGQTLWRVPIAHFTPWDWNWGWGPPPDAFFPGDPDPSVDVPVDTPNTKCGSIIECDNQLLGEAIHIVGTPYALHYQSDRQIGATNVLRIPLNVTGKTHPKLEAIAVQVQVAGHFPPVTFYPTSTTEIAITWDGYDVYGALTQGAQPIQVAIGYKYEGQYGVTASFGASGSTAITGDQATMRAYLWRFWQGKIGHYNAVHQDLGGWDLDVHHTYDPVGRTLYLGDGRRRSGGQDNGSGSGLQAGLVIDTFAGGASVNAGCNFSPQPALDSKINPTKIAFAPDGSAIIVDSCGASIRRVATDGTMTTLFGPATGSTMDVAVAPDGSIYFTRVNHQQVWKLDPQGNATVFAGTGAVCAFATCGDNGPATFAGFNYPIGLAMGPDGSLYVSDNSNNRIRKIGTDGIITTVAGGVGSCNEFSGACGDEGKATLGQLGLPTGLDVGPDGTLYIADTDSNRVRAVTPDGILHTVAGKGGVTPAGCQPLSGAATCKSLGRGVSDVAIGPDGLLYITASATSLGLLNKVLRVQQPIHAASGPNGVLQVVAGGSPAASCEYYECSPSPMNDFCAGSYQHTCGDGFPPNGARLGAVSGVAFGPDGSMYIADAGSGRVEVVEPSFPGLSLDTYTIPSEDAAELYVFDKEGRHLETHDALTNKLLLSFNGTPFNSVTDADGHTTTIQRLGSQTTITSPHGQPTLLGLVTAGSGFTYATTITNPANETVSLGYLFGPQGEDEGLLEHFIDPKLQVTEFQYSEYGRLEHELRPDGGAVDLVDTRLPYPQLGHTVALSEKVHEPSTFATTNYATELLAGGGAIRTTTLPGGVNQTTVVAPDGTETTTYPDDTTITVTQGPDPRFSVLAPVANVTIATGGKALSIGTHRDVVLSNPNLVTSLVEQTDTVTINSKVFTTTFNAAVTPRTVTRTTPKGRTTITSLGADDRPATVEVPSSLGLLPMNLSYYTNGPHKGRLHTMQQGSGAQERLYTLSYDAAGGLAQINGPEAATTSSDHDLAGRVIAKTLPGNSVIGFDYDPNGNLESLTPPGKPSHDFTHTTVDLLESYTRAVGQTLSVSYTPARQVDLVSRPDGETINPVYDSLGRLDAVVLASNTIDYQYVSFADPDHPGKLAQVSSSQDGVAVSYGYSGSLLTSTTWSGPISGSVTVEYDNDLRLAAETVGGTPTIAYGYADEDGLLTQAGDLLIALDDDTALVLGTTLGNVHESFGYNTFGEIAEHTVTFDPGGSATLLMSVTYERDGLGRLKKQTESIVGGPPVVTEYFYDAGGRLETVLENGSSVAEYQYDANRNRTEVDDSLGPALVCAYDTWDVLESCGGTTYNHDAHGDLVSRTAGGQSTTYTYDALGSLRGVAPEGGPSITYMLDGLGRRAGKKIGGALSKAWLYANGLNPIAELASDGTTITARFVYGTNGHVPNYILQGTTKLRLITDPRGSVRLVVDSATGVVVQRLDYDAYGRVVADTAPGLQPFGFAGGMYDHETGLVRFGARDYDPATGRWTARDPALFLGGANLYAYAYGDPVNYVDVDGGHPVVAVLGAVLFVVTTGAIVSDSRDVGGHLGLAAAEVGSLALRAAARAGLRALTRTTECPPPGAVGAMPYNAGRWGAGGFGTAADSLFHHFEKHGAEVGAESVEQYLRKAEIFADNLRRARSFPVEGATEGVMRYVKNGRYIDIAPDGSIISFGAL